MIADKTLAKRLLRSSDPGSTRVLFIARHPPTEPAFQLVSHPGDGGYPAYYYHVWRSLTELGYMVRTANRPAAVLEFARDSDVVFSLYNRTPSRNPEIFVSSLCDYLNLPCVGAFANTRALAEDKWLTKLAAKAAGLPVADGAVYATEIDLVRPPVFNGPYFVKNRFGAASEGISEASIQEDWAGASRIARRLIGRGMEVLVERYAPGIDITVPVIGGTEPYFLGVVRPGTDKTGGIITEDLKKDDPLGYELFDAGVYADALHADVIALWAIAGPIDYFRLDYRFDPLTGSRVFLEFNICCHVGRSGAVCLAARQFGADQPAILAHSIESALTRGQRGRRIS